MRIRLICEFPGGCGGSHLEYAVVELQEGESAPTEYQGRPVTSEPVAEGHELHAWRPAK